MNLSMISPRVANLICFHFAERKQTIINENWEATSSIHSASQIMGGRPGNERKKRFKRYKRRKKDKRDKRRKNASEIEGGK